MLSLGASFAAAQTLTVFAASSLTEAFEEVALLLEQQRPGVEVVLNFAGSSTLSTQITQGAPADVFASADDAQMQVVADAGLVQGEPVTFAHNRLVLVTPQASPVQRLENLGDEGVLLVLAGPEVPIGGYAREAVGKLEALFGEGFAGRVLANVVSEEPNVRQVAAKVALGEADAAIVYATDAAALAGVRTIEIPDRANVVVSYPIVALRGSSELELAQAFIELVLSEAGQRLLAARGFRTAR